jgi:putative PIN family toxin of toxin-antitoxin system
VIDTSVLVAGIAGFKSLVANPTNASSHFLRLWVNQRIFVWLVSQEILAEYKYVLGRLGVRRSLIGTVINLLREEAELIDVSTTVEISPDPADNAFCACAEIGNASFIVTLNPKDFPQGLLRAKVIPPSTPVPSTAPRRMPVKPKRV